MNLQEKARRANEVYHSKNGLVKCGYRNDDGNKVYHTKKIKVI